MMKLSLVVGNSDRHVIEFAWGQFFGTVRIKVDGVVVYRETLVDLKSLKASLIPGLWLYRTLMGKTKPDRLVQTWKLDVGFEERHQVQIIKKRPKVLAGLRPSIFRVFVDGELVEERKGY